MQTFSAFGGLAGETVRRFCGFLTLFTLIPALILTGLLGALGGYLCGLLHLPLPLPFLLMLIFVSPVIGRYALAARAGDLASGFLSGLKRNELSRFVGRYAVLTLAWGLPVGFLGLELLELAGASFLDLTTVSSAKTAFVAILVFLLLVAALLMPSLTLLVAVKAETLREALSVETWAWLLRDRRGDLPALYATFFGGLMVFLAVVWPSLLLLTGLCFTASAPLGAVVATFTYLAPAIASPVLLGRLAGAFVLADDVEMLQTSGPSALRDPVLEPRMAQATHAVAQPPRAASEPRPGNAPDALDTLKDVKNLAKRAETDLAGAITEAEALRQRQPRHLGLLAELAKLYRRAGRTEEALPLASDAIAQALLQGATPIAVDLFSTFDAERRSLKLSAKSFDQLAKVLFSQKRFDDAAWCFAAGTALGGDPVQAQKGLASVADAASRAGQIDSAVHIYDYLLRTYPESSFAQFWRDAAVPLKARQGKSASP
jgi:hypothetical protein